MCVCTYVMYICDELNGWYTLTLSRQMTESKDCPSCGMSKAARKQLYKDPQGSGCAKDKLLAASWHMMVQ